MRAAPASPSTHRTWSAAPAGRGRPRRIQTVVRPHASARRSRSLARWRRASRSSTSTSPLAATGRSAATGSGRRSSHCRERPLADDDRMDELDGDVAGVLASTPARRTTSWLRRRSDGRRASAATARSAPSSSMRHRAPALPSARSSVLPVVDMRLPPGAARLATARAGSVRGGARRLDRRLRPRHVNGWRSTKRSWTLRTTRCSASTHRTRRRAWNRSAERIFGQHAGRRHRRPADSTVPGSRPRRHRGSTSRARRRPGRSRGDRDRAQGRHAGPDRAVAASGRGTRRNVSRDSSGSLAT